MPELPQVSARESESAPSRSRSRFATWRKAVLGTSLVLAGLLTALVTLWAREAGDPSFAAIAAIVSLLFAFLITILVVPPLARSAWAEYLDLPFEITRGGLIFLGVLAVVGFAAWNTGNNLLFLIFSLLLATLLISWAAARVSLKDLVVKARFPDHIFAGDPAQVTVLVRNSKRVFPSFSILVEARGPLGAKRRKRYAKRTLAYFTYIPHRASAEQRVEQLFPKRGHVLITGFELTTRFPFGFFTRKRRLRARDVDIIVYPKPEDISDELHLLPMTAGRVLSVRRGAGHDLHSLRNYQPRDDLRHIDWKATARSRRLTVKEFTAEDERRITIALDTFLVKNNGDILPLTEKFERGVQMAASLIAHFITERAEVRLVLGDESGRYGLGREQLYNCLRRLALVEPNFVSDDSPDRSFSAAITETEKSSHPRSESYAILLTTAEPGSIPSNVWRSSHVIYL